MSTSITEIQFGHASVEGSTYIQIGFPLYGNERLGPVTSYSINKWGRWSRIATEVRCPGDPGFGSHDINDLMREGNGARCTGCDLVLSEMPTEGFAYGFLPRSDECDFREKRGFLTADIARYDKHRHGPNGARTIEEAFSKADAFLAAWKDWFGPGPWYAVDHVCDDFENELSILSGSKFDVLRAHENPLISAMAGPFDDLEHALYARTAWDERNVGTKISNELERIGWKAFDHYSQDPSLP